jgi:NH3-dependent NAD+ synthetase
METKKESVINITVDGRSIGMSYSQADALMNDIRKKMFECDEHVEDMKLVQERLKKFEESNRQFPDELFLPNSKRNLK